MNFVFAQCVGYAIHALYLVGYALVPARAAARTRGDAWSFYAVVPIVGVIVGFGIGSGLLGWTDVPRLVLLAARLDDARGDRRC